MRAYRGFRWGGSTDVAAHWNYLVVLPTGHCAGGAVAWPKVDEGLNYANEVSDTMFKALGSDLLAASKAEARLKEIPLVVW